MSMDLELQHQMLTNQVLIKDEIDSTRLEIGEAMVNIGEQLDELKEIIYGPEDAY